MTDKTHFPPAAETSAAASPWLTAAGARRPPRPVPFVTNDNGKPLSPQTQESAEAMLAGWRPDDTFRLAPLQPGWAGLQPYRAINGQGERCFLKLCMVDAAGGEPTPAAKEATMGEAQRAAWAGRQGLGPRVLARDPERGGFVTEWIDSQPITDADVRGPMMAAFAQAARRVHTVPSEELAAITAGDAHWLHAQEPRQLWPKSTLSLSAAHLDRLAQLERGMATLMQRDAAPQTPIHDDLHRRNALGGAGLITLIDWNNLKLGDPLTDVGHMAAFADVPVADYGRLLKLYDPDGGVRAEASRLSACERLTLHATYFDLRNLALMGQWKGELAPYLQWRVQDGGEALAPLLARELGLRLGA